jgi:TetR/AcrR family transcriptional repressor of nem operon
MPIQKIDKEELIKSALKVFKVKGYHKSSMADIAHECGLLKGSIYHYFASKEALMVEVLKYLRARYNKEVFTLAYNNKLSPYKKLQTLSILSEEIFLAETNGCFFTNIGLETVNVVDEFTVQIRGFFEDWVACLTHIFEAIMPHDEALLNAEQAVAEIEGAVMLMQIYKDHELLRRTHRFILKRYKDLQKVQVA